MINLTAKQWEDVNAQAKALAYDYTQGFEESHNDKGEIHPNCGGYEQREYGCNYYWLEKQLGDIIEDVIADTLTEEEQADFDCRQVEGFYELIQDVEQWMSDMLPNEWYVYFEDSDIWVARSWDDIDNIPEDVKHLVNE
jgi:hypothetical protein